ncbi:MAG: nitrilase-related carbon-nitrogen hydrolase [Halobacteriaceae archaeon]
MKLALVQFNISPDDVEENIDSALEGIRRAARSGADLVALPEIFSIGFFNFDAYAERAEPIGGPTHQRISTAARDNDIHVLAGTIVEDLSASASRGIDVPEPVGLSNTAVLFDESGERRLIYRKHHLWATSHESRSS